MANWLLYPQIGGARRARSSMLWLMTLSLVAVGGTSGMSASQLEVGNLAPHPRLRLTPAALAAMKAKIAKDPLAATVADQLAQYGNELLSKPVVNCSLTGVENSLLAQARAVLDLTYTLPRPWSSHRPALCGSK